MTSCNVMSCSDEWQNPSTSINCRVPTRDRIPPPPSSAVFRHVTESLHLHHLPCSDTWQYPSTSITCRVPTRDRIPPPPSPAVFRHVIESLHLPYLPCSDTWQYPSTSITCRVPTRDRISPPPSSAVFRHVTESLHLHHLGRWSITIMEEALRLKSLVDINRPRGTISMGTVIYRISFFLLDR